MIRDGIVQVGLATGIVGPVALGASAVTDDKVYFVGVLAATVAGVVGAIAWIDRRIEARIKAHEATELQVDQARHEEVLSEIKHLRELFARIED